MIENPERFDPHDYDYEPTEAEDARNYEAVCRTMQRINSQPPSWVSVRGIEFEKYKALKQSCELLRSKMEKFDRHQCNYLRVHEGVRTVIDALAAFEGGEK